MAAGGHGEGVRVAGVEGAVAAALECASPVFRGGSVGTASGEGGCANHAVGACGVPGGCKGFDGIDEVT